MHVAARFLMPIAKNVVRDVAGAALGAALNEAIPAISRAIGAPPPTPPLSDDSKKALALPTDTRPAPTASPAGADSVRGLQLAGASALEPAAPKKLDAAQLKPGALVLFASTSLDDVARAVERGDGRPALEGVGIASGRGQVVVGHGQEALGERAAYVYEPRDKATRAALLRAAATLTRDGGDALEAITRALGRESGRATTVEALDVALSKSNKLSLAGIT
jgi:hypothetical protein